MVAIFFTLVTHASLAQSMRPTLVPSGVFSAQAMAAPFGVQMRVHFGGRPKGMVASVGFDQAPFRLGGTVAAVFPSPAVAWARPWSFRPACTATARSSPRRQVRMEPEKTP